MKYLEVVVSRGDVDIANAKVNSAKFAELQEEQEEMYWSKGVWEVEGEKYRFVGIGEEVYILELPESFDEEKLFDLLSEEEGEWVEEECNW